MTYQHKDLSLSNAAFKKKYGFDHPREVAYQQEKVSHTQDEWKVVERSDIGEKISSNAKNRFVIQAPAENFPDVMVEIGTCGYKPHAQLFANAPETAAERDSLKCKLVDALFDADQAAYCATKAEAINATMLEALEYWFPYIEGHFDGVNKEHEKQIDKLKAALNAAKGE